MFDFLYSLNPRYIDVENEQEGRNYLVNNDLTACLSEYIVIKDNKFYVRSLNLSYEYYAILPKEELVQDISNYFINDTRLLEEINDYQNLSIDPNIGQVYYFCLDDVKLDTKNI
ncbi:hypothetical protein, partial [Corynebacterium amycolatum]|uniref:hypothetical protein n=1 Tax=Corynebacterium amycolatum TaxID=43765 RepID=UPI002119D9E3